MNVIPDLRRSPILSSSEAWRSIVIDGALTDGGMIGWGHLITAVDAENIRAFVADRALALQAVLARDADQTNSDIP